MNASLVSGIVFLVLLTLLPCLLIWLLCRRYGPDSPATMWGSLAAPLIGFLFGGSWFTILSWVQRRPNPPPTAMALPWVFFVTGSLSVAYCAAGMMVVFASCLFWRFAHRHSFDRFMGIR